MYVNLSFSVSSSISSNIPLTSPPSQIVQFFQNLSGICSMLRQSGHCDWKRNETMIG
jgi:hypothetical protein